MYPSRDLGMRGGSRPLLRLAGLATLIGLVLAGLQGCQPLTARSGDTVSKITAAQIPPVDSSGFFYWHYIYTDEYYRGDADYTLALLASMGIFPSEVWTESEDLCMQGSDTLGPFPTFIMKTEADQGEWIPSPGNPENAWMGKLKPGTSLRNYFFNCDNRRSILHYHFE